MADGLRPKCHFFAAKSGRREGLDQTKEIATKARAAEGDERPGRECLWF